MHQRYSYLPSVSIDPWVHPTRAAPTTLSDPRAGRRLFTLKRLICNHRVVSVHLARMWPEIGQDSLPSPARRPDFCFLSSSYITEKGKPRSRLSDRTSSRVANWSLVSCSKFKLFTTGTRRESALVNPWPTF